MSINDLVANLRNQATAKGSITLDNTILSDDQLTAIRASFGLSASANITVNAMQPSSIPDPTGNSITINAGNADLLNQTGIAVKSLSFTVGTSIDFILNLQMADQWKWTDSFPKLTPFPFNKISCSATYFVYTTKAVDTFPLWSASNDDSIPLATGLNLGTKLSLQALSKLPAIFGTINTDVKAAGPIVNNSAYPYPVMMLTAKLLDSFSLFGSLTISDLVYIVQITEPQHLVQEVISAVGATVGDMQILLDINQSTEMLRVTGKSVNGNETLGSLSSGTLGQAVLPAGTNFNDFVPSTFNNVFDSITFNGFYIAATLGAQKSIDRVIFSIGQKSNTHINLGAFDLTNFLLNVAWTNPRGASPTINVRFSASGMIPLKTFTAPLNFNIVVAKNGSWAIQSIEADYPGIINLADIIQEVAPGTQIPDELKGLRFGEFLLKADVASKDYTLSLHGYWDLTIMSAIVSSKYYLLLNSTNGKTTFELQAGFNVGDSSVGADITLGQQFTFTGEADNISLSDLLTSMFGVLGIDLSGLPEIMLNTLKIDYHKTVADLISVDANLTFGNNYTGVFSLVAKKNATDWQFIAYAGLGANNPIDIGALLPLIGNDIKGEFEIKDGFFIITSKTIGDLTLSAKPGLTVKPGISLGFDVVLAGSDQQLVQQILSYPDAQEQNNAVYYIAADGALIRSNVDDTSNDANQTGNVHSFTINKQIGPILFKSIGIKYADFTISAALDVSMNIGPLGASLDGLSAGIALKDDYKPVFGLNGLGIAYATPALTIEGALIRLPDSQLSEGIKFQFDGVLIVEAEQFGLSALGSYAQKTDNTPSFFLFVDINAVLGGPPPLIFTGLMGGLGINRNLLMPKFDEVQDFPLLAIGAPQSGSPKDIAMRTLQILEGEIAGNSGKTEVWIPPKSGDYWLAAGVKFTIADIISGELLLAAEFGNQLQFAVLGLASLSLPQNVSIDSAFVFVELQMEAVFQPLDGFLGVAASLTNNSFVLTKDCHLTGGFAFNLWFGSNPNAGQFVVTAGGYHPAFSIPDYYPKVQRLGFSWRVSGDVSIKGGSYFAITPSCAMGGGGLEVLYQSGPVKAWFTAQADLIVAWHPFSFNATLRIEIGASVRVSVWFVHKTVTVHLGADLELWGTPLGGKVKVHIVIVTVTIHFGSSGADDPNKEAISWSELKQMLPKPEDILKSVANTGVSSMLRRDKGSGQIVFNDNNSSNTTPVWIVRSGSFAFNTQSVIPASSLQYGSSGSKSASGPTINIRPMFKSGITSVHQVSITQGSANGPEVDVSDWSFNPVTDNLAANLWGTLIKDNSGDYVQRPAKPSADVVGGLLTGYAVQVPGPDPGTTFGLIDMTLLQEEYLANNAANPLNTSEPRSADYLPATSSTTISDIGGIATTLKSSRDSIYDVLKNSGLYSGDNDTMSDMGANATNLFTSVPMEQS
ncbi:hypothetical protein CLV59_103655 [Chitinophaga dinghuensis]|uniref:DUF6603 domain-containing protein n=1 Tax=Chitinophaga dinghuensis TaxID=1539050 RepID=A0A327W4T5_9BACT|nr:DUF6603 domain-containing protein [Chitinophaga dinghuensis]RAJ83683.1 hypothetical protein CLV59_103655 [Chitinophaga dinghuensis]